MKYNNTIDLNKSFQKFKSMLIETKHEQTRTVEIKLPFYSERDNSYYMITESEGVIKVFSLSGYCSVIVTNKESCGLRDYQDAIKGKAITEGEFWQAHNKALEIMKNIYQRQFHYRNGRFISAQRIEA